MITLRFDKELDKEVYIDFANFVAGGADFGMRIRRDHPEITKENYREYIDAYYESHREEMGSALNELRVAIETNEETFSQAVLSLLGQEILPGEYCGALSIFDCNPRYPEKKSFPGVL